MAITTELALVPTLPGSTSEADKQACHGSGRVGVGDATVEMRTTVLINGRIDLKHTKQSPQGRKTELNVCCEPTRVKLKNPIWPTTPG